MMQHGILFDMHYYMTSAPDSQVAELRSAPPQRQRALSSAASVSPWRCDNLQSVRPP